MAVTELEGTWEEIPERSAELSGRRVKVTVLSSEPVAPTSSSLDQAAEEWWKKLEQLEPGTPGPPLHGQEAEFEQILIEKYRKQGFKF